MKRNDLKIFTQLSSIIALAMIMVVPLFLLSTTTGENGVPIIRPLVRLTFLLSVFGIPLSIVSIFSSENLAKRIIVFMINVSPLGILVYGLMMEFVDEFLRTAP
ncbi:2-acyl-glycerophospho-ethanolamine acyltransferase [Rossellomorea marisflavi]|uniref:2-acyl-glycerophospho-ethanolamine acyltransferase n=1 Tax=Rossellomorea marisflavi TaxID=189381 RepID=UPI0025AFC935|nr:2-acyl-glycerophospho-ethanolamine acyltransferase [Rossellomorea marisflavi]MDW4525551.1 2-acyl-glycerophospho-ethanolamine acyltransferase [Rossellomorea marisflavi]WJV18010.1 2-acyl-glycerophospho-ethanolamine acyltransferase [Rossellomorea marisflavi]